MIDDQLLDVSECKLTMLKIPCRDQDGCSSLFFAKSRGGVLSLDIEPFRTSSVVLPKELFPSRCELHIVQVAINTGSRHDIVHACCRGGAPCPQAVLIMRKLLDESPSLVVSQRVQHDKERPLYTVIIVLLISKKRW